MIMEQSKTIPNAFKIIIDGKTYKLKPENENLKKEWMTKIK